MNAREIIATELTLNDGIWVGPEGNYWSNLNKDDNIKFLNDLSTLGASGTVQKHFPEHTEVIFSPKRAGGLLLLDARPGDVVVDAGCMWGALTLPLARTGCSVVGIEQTRESLALLKQRVKEEHLDNVELVCADLNQIVFRENSIDAVVVNGVLEWIPSAESIELKKYYGKKGSSTRDPVRSRPDAMQQQFLGRICQGLKPGGSLYLAIENRNDIFYFFGEPDPHCDLKFVTFLPRPLQDVVSRIFLGRPYVNWIYSPEALRELLAKAGFSSVDVFYAFPDYRFPDYVLSEHGMDLYRPFRYATARSRIKKIGCYLVESIVFQRLKLHGFAPALIAIARK